MIVWSACRIHSRIERGHSESIQLHCGHQSGSWCHPRNKMTTSSRWRSFGPKKIRTMQPIVCINASSAESQESWVSLDILTLWIISMRSILSGGPVRLSPTRPQEAIDFEELLSELITMAWMLRPHLGPRIKTGQCSADRWGTPVMRKVDVTSLTFWTLESSADVRTNHSSLS